MNVLVAHDGSPAADKALDVAARLAGGFGATVTIVTVVPDLCLSSEEISEADCQFVAKSLDTEARGQMKRVTDALAAKGLTADMIIAQGRPADQIVKTAGETAADLIVVGSVGKHGATRMFLGSVSGKVAELSPVDVYVAK